MQDTFPVHIRPELMKTLVLRIFHCSSVLLLTVIAQLFLILFEKQLNWLQNCILARKSFTRSFSLKF